MTVKFDKLAESLGLDAEVKEQITEAWTSKLKEARQEIAAELREEFAQKFEHDKATLIKSIDGFLTEKVAAEINEFAQDKQEAAAERVRAKKLVREHMELMERFITESLAREVRELRADRARTTDNIGALEQFVLRQLSEEVRELRQDKVALVEQRVKLVSENKKQLNETRQRFVKKSAAVIEENLNRIIQQEIRQYRDDIERARKNDFGRRIFEAFAGEYMGSHLMEGSEAKKLQDQIQEMRLQLDEAQAQVAQKDQLLTESRTKVRAAQDLMGRERTMNELMAPLGKRERRIMEELLENVKTSKLRERFDRYLPSVLNEKVSTHSQNRQPLQEGTVREYTKDRSPSLTQQRAQDEIDINQLRKLAGIGQ